MRKNNIRNNFNFTISIIIPVLNEERNISPCINHLKNSSANIYEIIVVDGGSTDNTVNIARQHGASVVSANTASRAVQMNIGAELAKGDILYFVHADTRPPQTFATDILEAVNKGYKIGGYRQKFDKESFQLRYNAFFSRFNFLFCRGGDQTIFIEKILFRQLNGFNPKYVIMEEYDLLKRARKHNKFFLIPKETVVSSRKYSTNSVFRVNLANAKAMIMFYLNCKPEKIKNMYSKALNPY